MMTAYGKASAPKAKILVVDDDRDVREFVEHLLALSGYAAVGADGAEAALAQLEKHKDIVLAVIDLAMPTISGIGLLSLLQFDYPELLTVVLSASYQQHDITEALENGADDYVVKPLERNVFLRKIQALLDGGQAVKGNRENCRRRVNFPSVTAIRVRGYAPRNLVLESSFRAEPGARLTFTSPSFSKHINQPFVQRYICRVTECRPEGKHFLLFADILGQPLEINSRG